MSDSWLVVGLGNPDRRYESTRHNAGARSVASLATKLGVRLESSKHKAWLADARSHDSRILVARPTTYMNESGEAVSSLCRWFKIDPENLIVIHDEIDLSTGSLRLKFGGSTAGNHGLDSIVEHLGTKEFFRVRIGVGRSATKGVEPADHVLQKMTKKAADELAEMEDMASDAALAIIDEGLDLAKGHFNRRASVE